ncbi:MAG: division/cell wall cluster transcriptional repressor MraZ [Gammaproteobacteria bacterium]|nr:division/cell wall cluster transcriptional repressor MraZ [Gammaproteobacteria bacterium]
MLRGVSSLSLDDKGRMVMPTRYRQDLLEDCEGKLLLTIDRDGCLLLYPLPEWEIIEQTLVRLSALDPKQRRLQRLMLGHATELDMDNSGRILLPPMLREFAKLEKHIVLVGQGNKFELWNEEVWNAQRLMWMEEDEDDGPLPEALQNLRL